MTDGQSFEGGKNVAAGQSAAKSLNPPFAPGQSPTNTVNVRITLPDNTVKTVPTTQDGSAALIAALQWAKLSANG